MSYEVKEAGEVEYTCKACETKAKTRSLKALPKGWCVTGILAIKPNPECETEAELERDRATSAERLRELGGMLGAHFCSAKEGKEWLKQKSVIEQVITAGVTLALWGKCDVVIDGAGLGMQTSSAGHEKGGAPPPATFNEGSSPI